MDRSTWDLLIGPENGSDYAIAHTKVEDDYWDRLLSANPQLEPKEMSRQCLHSSMLGDRVLRMDITVIDEVTRAAVTNVEASRPLRT